MDMDLVIAVGFLLIFTLIVGGVILLYPLSRKVGLLIESRIDGKRAPVGTGAETTAALDARLANLEEKVRAISARQEFLDDLLVERRSSDALPGGEGGEA